VRPGNLGPTRVSLIFKAKPHRLRDSFEYSTHNGMGAFFVDSVSKYEFTEFLPQKNLNEKKGLQMRLVTGYR